MAPCTSHIVSMPRDCELFKIIQGSDDCEIQSTDSKKIRDFIVKAFDPEPWNGKRAYFIDMDRKEMLEKIDKAISENHLILKFTIKLYENIIHEKMKYLMDQGSVISIMELA